MAQETARSLLYSRKTTRREAPRGRREASGSPFWMARIEGTTRPPAVVAADLDSVGILRLRISGPMKAFVMHRPTVSSMRRRKQGLSSQDNARVFNGACAGVR